VNASRAPWVLVWAGLALLTACGAHYVTRGADLYAGGHYIEAAEVFERTERRLERSTPAERARYGLYRGATLLALGDARRAEHWLRYSHGIALSETRALSAEERVMLGRALGVLATRKPGTPPEPEGAALATSQAHPAESPLPQASPATTH